MGTANSVKYSTTAISNCVNDITKDSTFVSAQATINNTNL